MIDPSSAPATPVIKPRGPLSLCLPPSAPARARPFYASRDTLSALQQRSTLPLSFLQYPPQSTAVHLTQACLHCRAIRLAALPTPN